MYMQLTKLKVHQAETDRSKHTILVGDFKTLHLLIITLNTEKVNKNLAMT